MPSPTHAQPIPPREQRDKLLDNEREANRDEPRNFKGDALTDKRVEVEPDGTGPTPTRTFDAPADRSRKLGKSKTGKPTTRRR